MPEIDPILIETVKNYLAAATAEMRSAFDRTAYDPIITDIRDYTVGLLDRKFNVIAETVGIPGFSGTLSPSIRTAVEAFGEENLEPGDVFINNYPYWGG